MMENSFFICSTNWNLSFFLFFNIYLNIFAFYILTCFLYSIFNSPFNNEI